MAEQPDEFKMANNKITLKLDGTVPLDLFNTAVGHFASLVAHLTEDIVGVKGVEWTVTELDTGSAFIEITGVEPQEAEKVASGWGIIGRALQSGDAIPYSQTIIEDALGITSVLNGKITGASFGDAIDVKGFVKTSIVYEQQTKHEVRDFGVVEGIVRSVSDTKGLRLGLYDEVFGKRIDCFVEVNRAEQAREIWRKRVRVSGMIRRNPVTGLAIDVREVTNIEILEPKREGAFLRARGAFKWGDDEAPEVAIRRMRDGE